jgi:hypothetical protein
VGHREKTTYLGVKLIRARTADGTSSTHFKSSSEAAVSLESADLRFDPLESCAIEKEIRKRNERWKKILITILKSNLKIGFQ